MFLNNLSWGILFCSEKVHWSNGTTSWTINNNANPYGEIDIIESYNDVGFSYLTLHTSNACTLSGGDYTGTNPRADCSLDGGAGCGVDGTDAQFGEKFNSAGGGVYVLSLQDSLKVWVFPRSDIPADITSGNPDPSGWGKPLFDFESTNGCDVASNFIDQTVVRFIRHTVFSLDITNHFSLVKKTDLQH